MKQRKQSRLQYQPSNQRLERTVKGKMARCARQDYFARTARRCHRPAAAQAFR
jgi:hypothetical protein